MMINKQLFILIFGIRYVLSYDPTIFMPYKEISTSELNVIGNTLQCNESRSDIQSCAEDCFKRNEIKENCVGFLKDGEDCFLCKVIDREGVNSNLYTTFNDSQMLYMLQVPKINPNIYISMEEFDLNTGTITGKGVSGASTHIAANDLIIGKVGQALHFGGWVAPAVAQPECYCSFYYCNGTMSLSFWARSSTTAFKHVITPPSGLTVSFDAKSAGWFRSSGVFMNGFSKCRFYIL